MWIESHQELGSHPKTKRLARRLSISLPAAVGHLHYLWWWTLDYSDQGDLSKYTAEDIADAMLWEDDVDKLIDALLSCGIGGGGGFLDRDEFGNLRVHDWAIYAGRLEHAREKNREKQQRWRDRRSTGHVTEGKTDHNGYVTGYETNSNPATVPNLTVPNHTKPNNTNTPAVANAPARRSAKPKAVSDKTPTEKKPHPYQEQIGALCEALDVRLEDLTSTEKGKFFKAAKDLGDAHRTRDSILKAASRWYPGKTLTALGLASNITDLLRDCPPPATNGYASNQRGEMNHGQPKGKLNDYDIELPVYRNDPRPKPSSTA